MRKGDHSADRFYSEKDARHGNSPGEFSEAISTYERLMAKLTEKSPFKRIIPSRNHKISPLLNRGNGIKRERPIGPDNGRARMVGRNTGGSLVAMH
jgi:hypothetical protein